MIEESDIQSTIDELHRAQTYNLPPARLTFRECEFVVVAATGLKNKEVAARFSISMKTVANLIKRALGKIDLHDRSELEREVFRQIEHAKTAELDRTRADQGTIDALYHAQAYNPIATRITLQACRVIVLAATGLRNKEIAAKLSISEKTVKSHLKRAIEKIGVQNRSEFKGWICQQIEHARTAELDPSRITADQTTINALYHAQDYKPIPTRLTSRECEIAVLAAVGSKNKEIATRLGISERRAKRCIPDTFKKIGLHDRSELTRWIRRQIESAKTIAVLEVKALAKSIYGLQAVRQVARPLTLRQCEISILVALKFKNTTISGIILISEEMIQIQRSQIYPKIPVDDRNGLEAWVFQQLDLVGDKDLNERVKKSAAIFGQTNRKRFPRSRIPVKFGQPLSESELRVVTSLSQGYKNNEIAEELLLPETIVKGQVRNIFIKTGATTRADVMIRFGNFDLEAQKKQIAAEILRDPRMYRARDVSADTGIFIELVEYHITAFIDEARRRCLSLNHVLEEQMYQARILKTEAEGQPVKRAAASEERSGPDILALLNASEKETLQHLVDGENVKMIRDRFGWDPNGYEMFVRRMLERTGKKDLHSVMAAFRDAKKAQMEMSESASRPKPKVDSSDPKNTIGDG